MLTKKMLIDAIEETTDSFKQPVGIEYSIWTQCLQILLKVLPDDEAKKEDVEPTQCPNCKSWFRMGVINKGMGCLVMHGQGSCCHFNDELVANKTDDKFNNEKVVKECEHEWRVSSDQSRMYCEKCGEIHKYQKVDCHGIGIGISADTQKELPEWEKRLDELYPAKDEKGHAAMWNDAMFVNLNDIKRFIKSEFKKMGEEIKKNERWVEWNGEEFKAIQTAYVDEALERRGVK